MRKMLVFLALSFGLIAPVQAQYGKNQVMWEKTNWNFYRSAHFDFYVAMDILDTEIQPHFEKLVAHAEKTYENLSVAQKHELRRRPLIFVTRTHSQFEGSVRIHGDPFMPEGVGAFAMPRGSLNSDLLLVVKLDFLPTLNDTILTHELEHIFQFDMVGGNLLQRVTGLGFPDHWLFEAVADYMANKFAPYTRDDIRRQRQRIGAANAINRYAGFPTLLALKAGIADWYAMGALVFSYLEDKYGQEAVNQLIVDVFKIRKQSFESLLMDLSEGEFATPELFDRAHRDYWSAKYVEESRKRAQPYSDTDNFKGRQVIKFPFLYPMLSQDVAPDGKSISTITISSKNGVVIATLPSLPREDPVYAKPEQKKKFKLFGGQVPVQDPKKALRILTKKMPPKPYEEITIQPWTRDGSDQDWWQDSAWVARVKAADSQLIALKEEMDQMRKDKKPAVEIKVAEARKNKQAKELAELYKVEGVSLIAFFAKNNRDHDLFIYDVNKGKIVKDVKISLDQAVSPAFSPDGNSIYFSAAKNIQRDIYVLIDVAADGPVVNLTKGGAFNTAPAVSPDGKKIAFVGLVGDFQKLFLLDLETGEKKQLTFGRWNDNSPDWSSDSKTLVFTSDEKDIIWNLYTLDLETRTTYQWTDFYGGVFTPKFMPGENDRVVYTAMFEQDQYLIYIYPNWKLFDARLKNPIRVFSSVDSGGSMQFSINQEETMSGKLDKRQLEKPEDPPARWKLYGRQVSFRQNGYWGSSVYTHMQLQDILANRTHSLLFAKSGDFKIYDYTFVDQSRRWIFAGNVDHSKYPLYYFLYNFQGQQPKYPYPNDKIDIFTLERTWASETSATLYAQYPFSKWDRVELGLRPRQRNFHLPYLIRPEDRDAFVASAPPQDVQFYDFFSNSSGQTNLGMFGALVHDTVISTYDSMGPLHGSAVRAQFEAGPGLNKNSPTYVTAQLDARRYQRISNSSLFAFRIAGMKSTRANGDFLMLGGTDTLHGYPYFSVFGNNIKYFAGELRFPVASVELFDSIPFKVRGTFFGDYATARFTNDVLPVRREWAWGGEVQAYIFLPMNFGFARTRFASDKFNFYFRIGFGF